MNKLQAGVGLSLTTLPESPAPFQPGKRTLYDSALREHCKGVQLIEPGYPHRRTQLVFDCLSNRLSRVACTDQHALDLLQIRCASVCRLEHSFAVCHIRCRYHDRMRQPLGSCSNCSQKMSL